MEGNSDTVAGLIIGLTGSAVAELGSGLAEGSAVAELGIGLAGVGAIAEWGSGLAGVRAIAELGSGLAEGGAIAEFGIGLAEGADAGVDARVEAESSGRIASAQTKFVAQRAQLVRKTDRNDRNRRGDMRYAKAKPPS